MPNVGGKKFAYTPEGKAAAAEYAQQTGAPFQMRAKAWGNSPMQKNFGSSLAINTQLDKDSGTGKTGQPGPVLKKLDITSKLLRQDMEGGLTGKPSTGELDGSLNKKSPFSKKGKGNVSAVSNSGPVTKLPYPPASNEIKVKPNPLTPKVPPLPPNVKPPKSKPYVPPKSNVKVRDHKGERAAQRSKVSKLWSQWKTIDDATKEYKKKLKPKR